MSTPTEIINEKTKQIKLLWDSKRMKELVTTSYTTDACLVDNGVSYKGHDEILKACEKLQHVSFDINLIDTSTLGDDCVVQTGTCEWDGKTRNGKCTWKKINGDWKITNEEWN